MNFLPDIFDNRAKYQPWLWEKYGSTFDTPKYKERRAREEKANTERDLRMKHGKKRWKEFTKDAIAAKDKEKNRLRPGEVKKLVNGKWVSNKD